MGLRCEDRQIEFKIPDMYALYFVAVFVSLAWSLPGHWESEDCPQPCTCLMERNEKKVYCDIQNKERLQAIPNKFPADSQFISLKGNYIKTIPAGVFSNLRDLRTLDLGSNELESLPPNIFRGLTSLEYLNLSYNRLGHLPSGLLHGLKSLENLFLDGNVLENLPRDFFQGLTSLRRLYLHGNKFNTLSYKLFGLQGTERNNSPTIISNLTSLVELLLNHNGIGQVQYDSFKRMSDLERLKLNNNNITTLPRGVFRDLKSLRLLSLYNNPFQCTCTLKWLKDWINHNENVTVFYKHLIKCEGPGKLRGKALLDINESEFECEIEWSEWSNWDSCSKLCNNGTQTRRRRCKAGIGKCKGGDTEIRWCNTHNCEPEWSLWSEWAPCSVTCSVGYQIRNRSTQCTRSPCQRQLIYEVRACNRKACPSYTEWSSWSMCDALCGQGKQVRKRDCTSSQQGGSCSETTVETRTCKMRICAEWASWESWSACSKSCSKGEQTRKRDCVIVQGSAQHNCSGNYTEKRECNMKECPVNGGWSPWTAWTRCSKTCGVGYHSRNRTCSNPYPQHGGEQCKGSSFNVAQCMRGLCLDAFTPWSQWSQCSKQCGKGFKFRNRTCTEKDPKTGKAACLVNTDKQFENCEGKNCEGTWGEWSPWSNCLGECNQGQTFRWRYCEHGLDGYTCENKTADFQGRRCKPKTCHYKPLWSQWSAWSACSKSCAKGTKRRTRYCITKVLGKPCPGNYEDKTLCNIHSCPIHGGWSKWSEWSPCDEPCDGGIKQRSRTCTEPAPQYNGEQCIGNSREKDICNKHRCRATDIQGDKPENHSTEKVFTLAPETTCPNLEQPKNGRIMRRKQKDGHMISEYRCDDYYRNQGPSTFRFCGKDGTWSGYEANCVPDCGEIDRKRKGKEVKKSIRNLTDFWPWQAAIEVTRKGVHCGGTLVGDQWVLTAAHCVLHHKKMKYYEEIKVILGTHDLSNKSAKEVQVINVNKILHHKDFEWQNLSSDIALLKLEKKVHITKYVHPVCLPVNRRRQRLIQAGQTGVFVGWGGSPKKILLRQIPLPVVKLDECERSYKSNRYKVTRKMLCAGNNDKIDGICKNDSGGGFVFREKSKSKRKRWVLGGIASWRHPRCKQKVKYSVFTDVTKHIDWILDKMGY